MRPALSRRGHLGLGQRWPARGDGEIVEESQRHADLCVLAYFGRAHRCSRATVQDLGDLKRPRSKLRTLVGAPAPDPQDAVRLRQIKEQARRFTAHEFWNPDNSRFELRLLTQPVHRYQDEKRQIVDGAIFLFAFDNNPQILLLIEVIRPAASERRWQYLLGASQAPNCTSGWMATKFGTRTERQASSAVRSITTGTW